MSEFINTGEAPYARTFGPDSQYFSHHPGDNETFLVANQNWFNHLLQRYGHVFLNEVYDGLGLSRTRNGVFVGWFKAEGSNPVQIEIVDDAIGGGLVLNFNPDGYIANKLPD